MKKMIAFLLSCATLSALCACAQPLQAISAAPEARSNVTNVMLLSAEGELPAIPTRRALSSFARSFSALPIDAVGALRVNSDKQHYKGSCFGFEGIRAPEDLGGLTPPFGTLPGANPPEEGIPTPPTDPVESADR